ncbi:MAG TPA: Flp family type IVb pilin [Caulobacteraceae bacterium]
MVKCLASFLASERGSTAVEYGLIVALISIVVVAAVTSMGTTLNSLFTTIGTHLNPAA